MSYTDKLTRSSVDDHRAYMRNYMKRWRAENPDRIKVYKANRQLRRTEGLSDGDRDRTAFRPETAEQAAMWARLLGEATWNASALLNSKSA